MNKLRFKILMICVLTALFSASVSGGLVTLDPTFNGTGYRIHVFNSDGAIGESVVVQPDGKIVLGGWTLAPAVWGSFAAIRLNSNGTPDTSFSGDGAVISTVANFNRGNTVLLQPDGKILLNGNRYFGDTNNDFTILRYDTGGTLDNSFDGNGVAAPNFNGFSDDYAYDMALQPDGKIVMVGSTAPTTTINKQLPSDLALMRFNTNGSLDPTFAGNGTLVVRFQNVSESANAVVIQPDGKIVIGGFLNNPVTGGDEFLLMRFNANGSLDTTFGTSGLTVSQMGTRITTMALQADGKILAGGGPVVARFTPDGVLDGTFGTGGRVLLPYILYKVIVRADDKFLTGGSNGSFIVSRFNANGTIDQRFNRTGTASAFIPGISCRGNSMALQDANKIVIGGHCTSNNFTTFAVARFQEKAAPTGIYDFDGDSKTDLSIFRQSNGEWWINRSGSAQTVAAQFGASTDKPVPADYTGDGKADIAFFRPASGEWFILRSENASFLSFPFGAPGDVAAVGDFDADNQADPAIFRPSTGEWYVLRSTGGTTITTFGAAGDVPVVADYDGDGRTDIAVFRPSDGSWWYIRSSDNLSRVFAFGLGTDKPVPGDWTGDGKADIAVWRPTTGEWFFQRSEDNSYYSLPFGALGDVPVPGDYDGDGRLDTAVFRPSGATWYVNRSTAGLLIQQFGLATDTPVPSVFVP